MDATLHRAVKFRDMLSPDDELKSRAMEIKEEEADTPVEIDPGEQQAKETLQAATQDILEAAGVEDEDEDEDDRMEDAHEQTMEDAMEAALQQGA